MEKDAVIGLVLVVFTVATMTGLVMWSRRAIEKIARKDLASARHIAMELKRERD